MAELSRRSGVTVPTIKFYLREGLLQPGRSTGRNQASYDEHHLRRLGLIRALVDLGQVPIAGVRAVLDALGAEGVPMHERIGAVHRAITGPPPPGRADSGTEVAAGQVRELIERRGWTVDPGAPAIAMLVDTVATMRSLGQEHLVSFLDAYAEQAERLAGLEVAAVATREDPEQVAESVVVGTILGARLVVALRLIAQENASAHLLRQPAQPARPVEPVPGGSTGSARAGRTRTRRLTGGGSGP